MLIMQQDFAWKKKGVKAVILGWKVNNFEKKIPNFYNIFLDRFLKFWF